MSLLSKPIQSRREYEPVRETDHDDDTYDSYPLCTETFASPTRDHIPGLPPSSAVSTLSLSSSWSRPIFPIISKARLSRLSIGRSKRVNRSLLVLILLVLLFTLPTTKLLLRVSRFLFPETYKELSHYNTDLQCRIETARMDGLPLTLWILRNSKYTRYGRERDYEEGGPNEHSELDNEDEEDEGLYDAGKHGRRDPATRTGVRKGSVTKQVEGVEDVGVGHEDESTWSNVMNATELMASLLSSEFERVPSRVIHQSWKTYTLPKRFAKWSKSWRKLHGPDWTYVLWTDADNRALVENFYPEYVDTYNNLPLEIYRVDMARNMYMHRFGGIYADLDLIALSPIPEHLPALSPSSSSISNSHLMTSNSTSASNSTLEPIKTAYVGRMSPEDYDHSIPNAFMASTSPGHPFWLQPLDFIRDHMYEEEYTRQPEVLTGPVALKKCVLRWENKDERDRRYGEGVFDVVEVLGKGKIYPFSWSDAPFVDQCVCRSQSLTFSPRRCKALYPNAWTITYWSHSWETYDWR